MEFRDSHGVTVLTYAGLKVWDADGNVVHARLEAAGASRVRIRVDERGARYPLTIDPIAQQAYFKASNTGADDAFGISVAVAEDTVVVGAWLEASSTTGVNSVPNEGASQAGAAYVFVRSGGTWTQQAYLKASNTGMFDGFGISVAVAEDTVVVGATGEDSSTTGVNGVPNEGASAAGAAYVFNGIGPPEIAVSGNSVNILDGDATPALADHTDFGTVHVASGTRVRTFTIQNSGTGDLTLGSVTVGGTHAADFTVNSQPPSLVSPSASTTFQVTFDPSAAGLRSAMLGFTHNDADENPFNFSIQGTGASVTVTPTAGL